jgi:short-subunit dehydrogenase
MGLELARQLAAKGANIVIVARRQDRLLKGLEIIEVYFSRTPPVRLLSNGPPGSSS